MRRFGVRIPTGSRKKPGCSSNRAFLFLSRPFLSMVCLGRDVEFLVHHGKHNFPVGAGPWNGHAVDAFATFFNLLPNPSNPELQQRIEWKQICPTRRSLLPRCGSKPPWRGDPWQKTCSRRTYWLWLGSFQVSPWNWVAVRCVHSEMDLAWRIVCVAGGGSWVLVARITTCGSFARRVRSLQVHRNMCQRGGICDEFERHQATLGPVLAPTLAIFNLCQLRMK